MNVCAITCPGCGERLSLDMKTCPSCRKPVIITSFGGIRGMSAPETNKYIAQYKKALTDAPDNAAVNTSIAFCYLNLKIYDKALLAFDKAAEENFDNPETFFYAAVCLLNGKKAFFAPRPTIDKILQYIDAANMIERRGVHYLLSAYVKYDYFARKCYSVSPEYSDDLGSAKELGVAHADAVGLFELLGVERPSALAL